MAPAAETTNTPRTQDTTPGPDQGTAGAQLPPMDRRSFLGALAAMVGSATVAQAQNPGAAPAPGNVPGVDTAVSMAGPYTAQGFLFSGVGAAPISGMRTGVFRTTAPGGVVLAVANALDQIGRNNIPEGHMVRITVGGLVDPRTNQPNSAEYWIDPKKVPQAATIDPSNRANHQNAPRIINAAINGDAGLKAFVRSLSATNDPDRLGVSVKVVLNGNDANFGFVQGNEQPANMTMQIVRPPARR